MEVYWALIKTSSDGFQLIEYYKSLDKAKAEYRKCVDKMYWGGINMQKVEFCQIFAHLEKEEQHGHP